MLLTVLEKSINGFLTVYAVEKNVTILHKNVAECC